MTEKTDKPKNSKVTWGTLAMAFFAMVTAVGDGVRSCNEREADREQAARAETDRVKVDTNIQTTSTATFEDIYLRIDELEDTVDDQDRALFECRVTNNTQDRLLEAYAGISGEVLDMVTLEALREEAGEDDLLVEILPEEFHTIHTPPPEERVEIAATEISSKKKKKRDKPKPKFDFAPPEPQYEQAQQILKQALPPKRKK
jgi:hypothetical protein